MHDGFPLDWMVAVLPPQACMHLSGTPLISQHFICGLIVGLVSISLDWTVLLKILFSIHTSFNWQILKSLYFLQSTYLLYTSYSQHHFCKLLRFHNIQLLSKSVHKFHLSLQAILHHLNPQFCRFCILEGNELHNWIINLQLKRIWNLISYILK